MRNSEIGTLLESLQGEIRIVAEGVTANREAIQDLRARVDHIDSEQEVLKLQVTGLGFRMDNLENEMKTLRGDIAGFRDEIRGDIAGSRDEIRDFRVTMEQVVLNHEDRIASLENRSN